MPLLDVTTREANGTALVTLAGELDISTSARLEEVIDQLSGAWPETVVIDLRGLSFIDSTGLRLILRAHGQASEHNGRFMIVRGPDAVHRVFEMTRLDGQIEFVDDPSTV